MASSKRNEKKKGFYFTILFLLLVGILLICGALLIRDNLIKSTHEFGQTLVKNYAAEEELSISNFKKQMELAEYNLTELKANGAGEKEFAEWFKVYKYKVEYIMGARIFNYYGVVDGKSYSAIKGKTNSLEFFKNRQWYKKALKANGTIIFTGIYKDKLTG